MINKRGILAWLKSRIYILYGKFLGRHPLGEIDYKEMMDLFYKAQSLFKLGQYSEALSLCDFSREKYRKSGLYEVRAWSGALFDILRADILMELNRYDQSLRIIDAFLDEYGKSDIPRLSPRIIDAMFHKARVFERAGRKKDALRWYQQVRDASKGMNVPTLQVMFINSSSQMVEILIDQNRFKEAEQVCEGVLKNRITIDKDEIESYARLITHRIYIGYKKGHYPEAISLADRFIEEIPSHGDASLEVCRYFTRSYECWSWAKENDDNKSFRISEELIREYEIKPSSEMDEPFLTTASLFLGQLYKRGLIDRMITTASWTIEKFGSVQNRDIQIPLMDIREYLMFGLYYKGQLRRSLSVGRECERNMYILPAKDRRNRLPVIRINIASIYSRLSKMKAWSIYDQLSKTYGWKGNAEARLAKYYAYLGKVYLLIEWKKIRRAENVLRELARRVKSERNKVFDPIKLMMDGYRADILNAMHCHEDALAIFDQLILKHRSMGDCPSRDNDVGVMIARAETLLKMDKYCEALDQVEIILKHHDAKMSYWNRKEAKELIRKINKREA